MGPTSKSRIVSGGQGFVEYALLLVLILVVVFGALVLAGPALVPIAYDGDNLPVALANGGRGTETAGDSIASRPLIAPDGGDAICTTDLAFAGAELEAGMDSGSTMAALPTEQFVCNMGKTLGELQQGEMSIRPVLPDNHYLWIAMDHQYYVFHGGLPYGGEPVFSGPIPVTRNDLLAWEDGEVTFRAYYFGSDVTRPWKGMLTCSAEAAAGE